MQVSHQWQCPRFDAIHLLPTQNNYALVWFWPVYINYLTTLIDLPVCQDIFSLFPNLFRVVYEDNPTTSNATNNALSGVWQGGFSCDKKSFVSSKICGIFEIIVFRWKLRIYEIFLVAVPLFGITKRPGTFDLHLCILGSR